MGSRGGASPLEPRVGPFLPKPWNAIGDSIETAEKAFPFRGDSLLILGWQAAEQ